MPNWNRIFTDLIRTSSPRLWGNWSLDVSIAPGAVGVVGPDTAFRKVGALSEVKAVDVPTSEKWKLSTDHVRRKKSNLSLAGGGGGTVGGGATLTAGGSVKYEWTFEKTQELVSEFRIARRQEIQDLGGLVKVHMDELNGYADQLNMRTDGTLDQGFGIVTSVIWAKSGVNAASLKEGSTLSISGQADAVGELLGDANVNAHVSASYQSIEEGGSLDIHVWPDASGKTATGAVPLAFLFASFDGATLLPAWSSLKTTVVVELENRGGFIAQLSATYSSGGKRSEKKSPGVLAGNHFPLLLPRDASDLELIVTYQGSSVRHVVHEDSPFVQWGSGRAVIVVNGVLPIPHFSIRYPE